MSAFSIKRYTDELFSSLTVVPPEKVEVLVSAIGKARSSGRTVFLAGNGGSAATANHFACDLSKNIAADAGKKIRAVSLSTLTEALTAYGNDLDFTGVFAEQLRVLGGAGDLLIAISASGRSPNIVEVVRAARQAEMTIATLTGFDGGTIAELSDIAIVVPLNTYEQIEDAHSIVLHMVVSTMKTRSGQSDE